MHTWFTLKDKISCMLVVSCLNTFSYVVEVVKECTAVQIVQCMYTYLYCQFQVMPTFISSMATTLHIAKILSGPNIFLVYMHSLTKFYEEIVLITEPRAWVLCHIHYYFENNNSAPTESFICTSKFTTQNGLWRGK